MISSDSPDPVKGWQGDGVDVEIQRTDSPPVRWIWTLYDRDRMVTSGVARSHGRARRAAWFRKWIYRWIGR